MGRLTVRFPHGIAIHYLIRFPIVPNVPDFGDACRDDLLTYVENHAKKRSAPGVGIVIPTFLLFWPETYQNQQRKRLRFGAIRVWPTDAGHASMRSVV